jgi:aryl-alcohol dehydrogenase-like predicted oxidoreductase
VSSNGDYAAGDALAANFHFLVSEKDAENMAEAAIRFALSRAEISTLPTGFSSIDQLDQAIKSVERRPFPQEALGRLPEIWRKL